jgi:hypothetical protein
MNIFNIAIKYMNKYMLFVGNSKLFIKYNMLKTNMDKTVMVADSMYFDFIENNIPIPEVIRSNL